MENTVRKVTVIPTKISPQKGLNGLNLTKRKVAGYARVSTNSDEQYTSYEAQITYYQNYIKSNPNYEFVGIYTDEGISGTSIKNRTGFNKMIEDALKGKIDLIITKSISRFARNTVDSLTTIRKLKENNVECYFEKENIYTFDGKGELLITIMSSLAQEESRSISQNITWGHRKSFKDGKIHLAYSHFLGFKKGKNGKLEVVPEEAEIVREIYSLFINGETPNSIAKILTSKGIKTPANKDKWSVSTVLSILTNEKYKGDALLQKTITTSYLTHKVKTNEGEAPKYYVSDSHEAIIDKDEWDMVQLEIKRRQQLKSSYSSTNMFFSKVVCADCGGVYGRKVWHSTDKYKRVVYQCNDKFKKNHNCKTPTLDEEDIINAFIKAYSIHFKDKDFILNDLFEIFNEEQKEIEKLDKQIKTQEIKATKLYEETFELIKNSSKELSDSDYSEQIKIYDDCYDKLQSLRKKRDDLKLKLENINGYLNSLKEAPIILEEWDRLLFNSVTEKVVVHEDKTLEFKFIDGKVIKIEL